jgi:THO complex subunit 2
MPPVNRRKRPNPNATDDVQRPSPHRPSNLGLAQQSDKSDNASARRSGRGNRGTRGKSAGSELSPSAPSNAAPPTKQPVVDAAPSSTPVKPPTEVAPVRDSMPMAPPTQAGPALITALPFVYEYLTDDCISRWKNSGAAETKAKALEYLHADDRISLSLVLQEIMRAVMQARLEPQDGGKFIQDILREDKEPADALSLTREFLDCFSSLVEAGLPDVSRLRSFLINTKISSTLMREQFESPVLVSLGLVRTSFAQMGTRYSTNVLYKQTTYNLLREDTEGYAKLVSEYYLAAESGAPTTELIQETAQKVKSLIGAFNIDPGRSLDVTLDVFGDLLVKRHKFFVRYLRASSFWPQPKVVDGVKHDDPGFSSLPSWADLSCTEGYLGEDDRVRLEQLKETRDISFWHRAKDIGMQAFFEIGGRQIISSDQSNGESTDPLQEADRKWIETTKTYPPEGNKVAAQLLGFKLRFYASDLRDESTHLPENLIWLAALLIHIGFISLTDLWPHLYPSDEDMPAVKERLKKEKAERELKKRPGGGMNALLMAGALVDDTLPPPRIREPVSTAAPVIDLTSEKTKSVADEDEKIDLPEPQNQKILLLRSLLLIGAIPDAMFMLSRFPWLVELDTDLMKYIHRILNYSLSQIANSIAPLQDRPTIGGPKAFAMEQTGLPRGHLISRSPEIRKLLKWGFLDSFDTTKSADYKFYWDDWNDNVPICRTVDNVFTLCSTLLNLAGVRIGEDPELLMKLARVGIHSLREDESDINKTRWRDLCKRLLIPALSFTDANAGLVNEVWTLLEEFSLPERYSIYAEWYGGQISRLPEMQSVFNLARSKTKDVLKRISKTNTREMARALAKVAYSSPGIVFSATLNQIESYDNLIDVVVECARYFTSLGYDVLTWSILSSLGGGGRNRMQADGMLTSQWLRALSVFAGQVFRRYSFMKPYPILRYVANQLANGRSEDLEILEQIVASMAGIRSDTHYSDEQVRAMAGGPLLRAQTLKQLLDKRYDPTEQRNAKRLIDALVPSNLAGQLLILIAQERQQYIFQKASDDAPLKVLGSNVDKIHHAFIQYLDMLRTNVSITDFKKVTPDIDVLMKKFGLDAVTAFAICREDIRHELAEADKDVAEAEKAKSVEQKDKTPNVATPTDHDVTMQDSAEPTSAPEPSQIDSENGDKSKDAEMTDAPNGIETSDATSKTATSTAAVNPVMQSLIEKMRNVVTPEFEQSLSLQFYVRFWEWSLYDLNVPRYDSEIKEVQSRSLKVNNDRRDVSVDAARKREAEKKKLAELQESLTKEMKSHVQAYTANRNTISREKEQWLSHLPLKDQSRIAESIIQECLFPRAIFSAEDAIFTWRFVWHCHYLGTPGFRTMYIFDKFFKEKFLRQALFQCTTREADHFGQFLNEILKILNTWHRSQDTYKREAWGTKQDLTGFCKKVKPDWTPDVRLEYEDFRRLLFKWHGQLHQAIKACLGSQEYMHVRNAIILLKAIHSAFPRVTFQGQQLVQAVTDVSNKDSREDLKLSALSLLGDLKKREKDWVLPQDFRAGAPGSIPGASAPADKSKDGKIASDSQTSSGQKVLDPKVPEFQPSKAT